MRLRTRVAAATLAVSVPMVVGLVAWDFVSKRRAAEDELVAFTRALAASPGWIDRCEADPASFPGDPSNAPLTSSSAGGPPPGGPPPGRPPPPGGPPSGGPPPGGPPTGGPPTGGPGGPPPGGPPPGGPPPPPPPGAPPVGPGSSPFPHSRPARFVAFGSDLTSQHPGAPAIPSNVRASIRDRDALALTPPWQNSVVRVLVRSPRGGGACAFLLAEGTTEPWLGGILPPTHLWLLPLVAVFASVILAMGPTVHRIRVLTAAARRSAESDYESGVPSSGRDEVTELAVALDEAARQVRARLEETRRSEETLREFLANTTHDIMVPLTVLQGHLSDLRRAGTDGSAPSADALSAAMNEAHYIGALIHNLAIAAKLDSAAPEPDRAPVDLAALVERVVSRHRPIARSLEVSLDRAVPNDPLVVEADVTLIEQAVGNLVYNAIRYNRAGGHVAVIVEAEGTSGFAVRVIDDGPGIPDEDLSEVLARGARSDQARKRAPDGRGLGLDITARVVRLHDYRLALKRSEYGGLEVVIAGERRA